MSFTSKLWRLLSSRAVNLLIGIAGLAIGIYGIWFYHPRPALVFDTLSDTKVLDVHAPLGKLDIVYAGESLKATNRELRLIVIRISNAGSADIAKDSFDADNPLGLRVSSGTLLEPPTLAASNEYLSRNVRVMSSGPDSVTFKPVILEAREWIELKLLVAVQAGLTPEIAPVGKIAGIRKISSANTASERLSKPLWSRLVGADAFWIQLARIPIYLIGLVLLLLAILVVGLLGFFFSVFPVQELNSLRKRRRRARIVEKYGKTRELRPTDHFVVDEYLEAGSSAIPHIRSYIEGISRHNAETEARKSILEHLRSKFDQETIRRTTRLRRPRVPHGLQEASRRGLQSENNGILSIDPDLARAVDDLERFLRAHGDIPREQSSSDETVDIESLPEDVRVRFLSEFDDPLVEPRHERP
jgi:hypothetical protein